MRINYRNYLFAFVTIGFVKNAFASSVITDAAYYWPNVPKQLLVNTSYEEIAICQTATTFAMRQGRLVITDNLITNTNNHYDFWNATSALHAEQNSYAPLSDASGNYLMSLLTVDESYLFSNEDILFLAKRGLAYRYEHQEYIYDNFFVSCEATVQSAKLRSLEG